MKRIILAAILGLAVIAAAREARAQVNPIPWPATWNCSQGTGVPCLRINNNYPFANNNTTALQLWSVGSRTLDVHSDTDGAILATVGSQTNPNLAGVLSTAARVYNWGQGWSMQLSGPRGLNSMSTTGAAGYFNSASADSLIGIGNSTSKFGAWFENSTDGPAFGGNGDVYVWEGNIYVSSTGDLKKDVVKMTDGLAKVMAIEPVWFSWKDASARGKGRHPGVIAEQACKVAPELCSVAKHTSALALAVAPEAAVEQQALSVNYNGFGVLALDAIRSQQHLIEAQQKVLVDQEKRLAALEAARAPQQ